MTDAVNHPAHYKGKTFECIEIIEVYGLDHFRATALAYVLRHHRKNGEQDLRKAVWYLRRLAGSSLNLVNASCAIVLDPEAAEAMDCDTIAEDFDIPHGSLREALSWLIPDPLDFIGAAQIRESALAAVEHIETYLASDRAAPLDLARAPQGANAPAIPGAVHAPGRPLPELWSGADDEGRRRGRDHRRAHQSAVAGRFERAVEPRAVVQALHQAKNRHRGDAEGQGLSGAGFLHRLQKGASPNAIRAQQPMEEANRLLESPDLWPVVARDAFLCPLNRSEPLSMLDITMPPMPMQYRVIQIAYAKMIAQVQDAVLGTRLTPQMALLLAFIGDQEFSPSDLKRYGYFIGTKVTYNIDELVKEHLVERINSAVSSDRRRRPVKLTPAGRRLAAALRVKLANCQGKNGSAN